MKKILIIITFMLLIGIVYADCEYILPTENQDAPFHIYECIDINPKFFGYIKTDDASITDVNLLVGNDNNSLNGEIETFGEGNKGFYVNLPYNSPVSINTSLNVFPRKFFSKFQIEEENISISFPFSFFR
jgi:hypothetical protein